MKISSISLAIGAIYFSAAYNNSHAAAIWTDQPSLYKQQKSNATTPATRNIKLTAVQMQAYLDAIKPATPPVVVPPVPTGDINDGTGMMPYVNTALIPKGSLGKDKLDLIPEQYPPKPSGSKGGEFRITCDYSHMLNDDPIVKPNQPGKSHLHTFFGNVSVNAASTNESLVASGNSTCAGGIMNRSSYWIPSVIDTRTGRPLAPEGANFYYKTFSGAGVTAPPKGLRIVTGDMMSSSKQEHIHFWCASPQDTNTSGDRGYIPSCPVGSKVLAVINFPVWWDGRLDSEDHKSHMSYSRTSTHTKQIPDITFNIAYRVEAGDDTSFWRLSSDMYSTDKKGGYSLHGDWMNGWITDEASGRSFSDIFTEKCLNANLNCGNSLLGDGRQYYY